MDLFRKKTADMMEDEGEHSGLKKKLRAIDLAALGIGSVVGTGIFVATGSAAQAAGPAVIISFILAALVSGFCALTYSELATMFPVAGSTYSYSYVAFGEFIAWVIGWDLMLEYVVSASTVASGWSSTLVALLANYGVTLPTSITTSTLNGGIADIPAILITLLVTWILYIGIKESANVNNIIVGVKIIVILLFIFLGSTHINLTNFHPFAPFGWRGIMQGAALIFFSYIGFDAVSTAAEETVNPKRDVPLGLVICLGVVIVLYVAIAFVLCGIVPFKSIDITDALPAALRSIGINWGGALVATGAIIGMISTLLVTLYGQIRIFMVMSRDGLLPPVFAKLHTNHKTPHICTWITGIICAVLAGLFPLNVLIELCNIGTLFAFILVSVGVIILRKTMPNIERKFRCPWVPVTPIITVLLCLYFIVSLPPVTWLRFIIWLAGGSLLYFVYGFKHSSLNDVK
ncbi:amino acid permease [Candidatus Clostridium stratigraminis]|uniref:Amino acid permease n=1 Tax=Candidatus Clostridium stratigraminis TaxID=3381661 RepID=A0ABW8T7E6_9CLOT